MGKRQGGSNYGIQADSVSAKNLAVGDHARATLIEREVDMAQGALQELRTAIEGLNLRKDAHKLLASDISAIEAEINKEEPEASRLELLLKGFADKLKITGVILKEGAGIIEPLKKLAKATGIGLAMLGL